MSREPCHTVGCYLCCQGKLPIVPAQAAQLHNLSRLAQGLQEVVCAATTTHMPWSRNSKAL